mgnify:CR=1 FL=1
MNEKITILTPSYNRAHTLPNLYKSLLLQDNQNFEWLIVDDGSKDNTKELVNSFCKDEKIKITYLFQKNGGKHSAINTGIKKIENCRYNNNNLKLDAVIHRPKVMYQASELS